MTFARETNDYNREQSQEKIRPTSDGVQVSIRSKFDRWAPSYEESPLQSLVFRNAHDMVMENLDPGPDASILDIGCGTGIFARRLASLVPRGRVIGIDLSPRMIKEARLRAGATTNLDFEVAEAHRLPYPDCCFSRVICSHSFHMHPDKSASLLEMFRVLEERGRLFIADIGRYGLVGRIVSKLHETFTLGEGKIRIHTCQELEDLMRGVGLRPVISHESSLRKGLPTVLVVGEKPDGRDPEFPPDITQA